MADITIREARCADDAYLLPDTIWQPDLGFGDWQRAEPDETLNAGGLRAKDGIHTAVLLALFTDRRVPPTHPCFFLADGNPGGWWGDGVDVRDDLGERALGSYLWLLERAPMTIAGTPVEMWARQFALEALAPLQQQGAVARIEVEATANVLAGRLELLVRLFGRDGLVAYQNRFETLWKQVAR